MTTLASGKNIKITDSLLEQNIQPEVTAAQLTANVDDYNPPGLATAGLLKVSSDAQRNITGMVAQPTNTVLYMLNVGNNRVRIQNEDVSSAAANRFSMITFVNLDGDELILFWYDGTASRWRVLGI